MGSHPLQLSGQRFGRLTVIERMPSRNGRSFWKAKCDCGNEVFVLGRHLISGNTRSCGCLRRETTAAKNLKNKGIHRTEVQKRSMKEYRIWQAMKARCYAPSQTKGHYKDNNIQVCDRWLNSFDNFLADMGKCPFPDASIERIDNLGDYCPENCKWIHQKYQNMNTSRSRRFKLNGETICLKEACEKYGVSKPTFYARTKRGLSPEEIFL